MRIVASVEESTTIRAILDHFAKHVALEEAHYRPAGHDTPKTKPGKEHDVATILQGVVRTAVGNRREIALRTALPKTH